MKAFRAGESMKENTQIALLKQSIEHINETMMRMEKRFDQLDHRFDYLEKKMDDGFSKIDKKFDKVDEKLEKLDDKIEHVRRQSWSQFRWIIGAIVALFVTISTVLIQGHMS